MGMFVITNFCLSNTKQDCSTQDTSNTYTDALNLENILQFDLQNLPTNKSNTHNIISLRMGREGGGGGGGNSHQMGSRRNPTTPCG
jgi:hypothetical protein